MTAPGRRRRPAACGTESGYHRHRRVTRTQACPACCAAHAAATRTRWHRRKNTTTKEKNA